MRVAIDSNIIAYAEGLERIPADAAKVIAATQMLACLDRSATIILAVQVIGETYNVLTRRGRYTRKIAALRAADYSARYETRSTSPEILAGALDLAARHGFSIWDAIIVTVAADAGCVLLLSEDMQDGFVHRGMTIANPFAPVLDARLASLLAP